MAMQHQFGADAADHRLECPRIGQVAPWLRAADVRRMVDEHNAKAGGILAETCKYVLSRLHLLAADATARHEGQSRDC